MLNAMSVAELLRDNPPTLAQLKRFLARSYSREARLFLDALYDSNQLLNRIIWLRKQFEELEKGDFAPPPLITGDDLVARGLKPGPAFKRILHEVYDAQLELRISTKVEAMEMALQLADTFGGERGH